MGEPTAPHSVDNGWSPTHTPTGGDPPAQAHTGPAERLAARMTRLPTHMRILVLTFPDAEQAEAWDRSVDARALDALRE